MLPWIGAIFAFLLAVDTAYADIQFSRHVQSNMVLQQAPAKAAVYGALQLAAGVSPSDVQIQVRVEGSASYISNGSAVGTDQWIAYLRPAPAGGSYDISATCIGCSTEGSNSIMIQNATFGEVWFCSGQSNMALPLLNTMSRNQSLQALRAGKYTNIRLHQLASNMNPDVNWMTAENASRQTYMVSESEGLPLIFLFASTCYYFAETLTDFLGKDAPPIGLINTAMGGTKVQQWTSNATLAKCRDVDVLATKKNVEDYFPTEPSQAYFDSRVLPFANMTIKGFLWYQGENNMVNVFGNSAQDRGYACVFPKMIAEWRALFSREPQTTDPEAPFGVVSLTPHGNEGHPDIGGMLFAQTASHGVVPNPAMPNTFMAQAFDLDDPFSNITCHLINCQPMNVTDPKCRGCEQFDDSLAATSWLNTGPLYLGALHPRNKKVVAERLAQAAYGSVYSGDVAVRGPVLSGCTLDGNKLTIRFNKTLLAGDRVEVGPYYRPANASYLQILTNSSLFCLQSGDALPGNDDSSSCVDDGSGQKVLYNFPRSTFASLSVWPMVNVRQVEEDGATIIADVSGYEGSVFGVRYAWLEGYGGCCGLHPPTQGPCPEGSCPLKGKSSKLPVNPFVAKIESGKCVCVPPQVCDEQQSTSLITTDGEQTMVPASEPQEARRQERILLSRSWSLSRDL